MPPLRVLYLDNHLIAVFKPANLLTQGDRSGDPSLMDVVKDWIKEHYAKPGRVFLGLLHRLDRPVAGVVLFARTSKAASRLAAEFRERRVVKTYWALVEGIPTAGTATLTHFFERDEAGGVRACDGPGPGRKLARLRFRLLRPMGERALLEVDLETGRKHQIRVQLARIGHPIVGDRRYGAATDFAGDGLGLLARSLRFRHPIGRDRELTIAVPEDLCASWQAGA